MSGNLVGNARRKLALIMAGPLTFSDNALGPER